MMLGIKQAECVQKLQLVQRLDVRLLCVLRARLLSTRAKHSGAKQQQALRAALQHYTRH